MDLSLQPRRYVVRRQPPDTLELLRRAAPFSPVIRVPEVVRAYAEMDDGSTRPVRHHVLHSVTGFEFGYEGAGPADLARCLLIDWFGEHERAGEAHLELPVSYRRFEVAFIARVPHSRRRWEITASEIQEWVRAELGEL